MEPSTLPANSFMDALAKLTVDGQAIAKQEAFDLQHRPDHPGYVAAVAVRLNQRDVVESQLGSTTGRVPYGTPKVSIGPFGSRCVSGSGLMRNPLLKWSEAPTACVVETLHSPQPRSGLLPSLLA